MANETLRNGLIAAWAIEGLPVGNETALDESGNGYHLSLSSGVTFNSLRNSLQFDGTSNGKAELIHYNHRTHYDPLNFGSQDFSIHFRFRINADSTCVLYQYSNVAADQRQVIVYYYSTTKKIGVQVDNGPSVALPFTAPISLYAEHDLNISFDQSTVKVYLDGTMTSESVAGPVQIVTDSNRWPTFGIRADGNNKLTGEIKNIMFWGRALSATEFGEVDSGWLPEGLPRKINVVCLNGQSNAVGVDLAADLTDSPCQAFKQAIIADGRSPDKRLRPIFHDKSETTAWGTENTLGETLGRDFVILKYAQSATNLYSQWQPGGSVWLAAKAHFEKYRDELLRMGFEFEDIISVEVRGEADTASTEANALAYAANHVNFRGAMDAVWGKPCKYVISRLSDNQALQSAYVYLSTVQAQQDIIANEDLYNRAIVNTDDLGTFGASNPSHFTADSQVELGRRLGRAVIELTGKSLSVGDAELLTAAVRADIERTDGMLKATKDRADALPDAADNADAVLDAAGSSHNSAGSIGAAISTASSQATLARTTADTIDGKLPANTATKIGLIEAMRGTDGVPTTAAALAAATPADLSNLTVNKRLAIAIAPQLERPESGSVAYQIIIASRDADGDPVALDAVPTLTAEDATGTDLSAKLSAATAISGETGYYKATYTVASGDSLVGLLIKASGAQSSSAVSDMALSTVVDTIAVDFTASDRALLNATKNTTDAAANNATLAASRAGDAKTAAESVDGKLTTARAGKLDNIETKAAIAAEVNSVVEAGQVGQDAAAAAAGGGGLTKQDVADAATLVPTGEAESLLDKVGAAAGAAVSAETVDDSRTLFAASDGYRSKNIIDLTGGFAGTLAIALPLNDAVIDKSQVHTVAISGPAVVTASDIKVNRKADRIHFDVAAMTTQGEYTVTATVKTVDGQTIPMTGTVRVH